MNACGECGRRRGNALVALVLAMALSPAETRAAGEYRTFEVASLTITIDTEWVQQMSPGYLPARFDITNLGDARTIELVGTSNRFIRGLRGTQPGTLTVRQRIALARGARVRLTIPVPVFADHENLRFELRENGDIVDRFHFSSVESGVPPGAAGVLIVAAPGSAFAGASADWVRIPGGGSGSPPSAAVLASPGTAVVRRGGPAAMQDLALHPSRLPTNWLGYTSVRSVLIGPEEWRQIDDAQRRALLTWLASGGDLMLVDGSWDALLAPAQTAAAPVPQPARAYGFGRVHFPAAAAVASGGLTALLADAEKAQDGDLSLPANRSTSWGVIGARGFRLAIPGVAGVPARTYLFILLVFSFLIGPVNYGLLWRRRRQVLVVLTAPLLSIVFIVLLGVYVLAGEGLGVRGRAVSFTMLDQLRGHATTRSMVSLYAAGMTPSGGLRFSRDTALFPFGSDSSRSRDSQVLDLTEIQRFSSGVIQARVPSNFDQIVHRTARERLSFSREDGTVIVVNGLGTPIAALAYREGGTIYRLAAPLAAGARAVLEPSTSAPAIAVPADIPLAARFRHLIDNQPGRSYLAVLDASPFWESGHPRVVEAGSFHLVIGWPEGQP